MTELAKFVPRVGLALGGGGARGLAHIAILEAFDELGIRPSFIAGSSMGALIAAAYAGGMSGQELRQHAIKLLSNRMDMMRHIFGTRKMSRTSLFSFKGLTTLQLDGRRLVDIALPDSLPSNFADLKIPLCIVTTDYDTMMEQAFTSGELLAPLAASIAIPGIIAGQLINGHHHVDGGVTNPVPFDYVRPHVDIVVASDVTGKPKSLNGGHPTNLEAAVGSLLIMFQQIASLRRALNPPDIYIEPDISQIGTGDFFRIGDILAAAEPAKQALKTKLSRMILAEIA